MAVEQARIEPGVRGRVAAHPGQLVAQMGTFLLDRADQAHRHRRSFAASATDRHVSVDTVLMSERSKPGRSRGRILRHPAVIVGVIVLVIATGFAAYWFQPWRLFTETTVDEAPPSAGPQVTATGAAETEVVAQGQFVSQEHDTSGMVRLLRLPDQSLVVRVENLETSDGPDLKVWLTDAPVSPGVADAGVFDDGRWVDLGSLKGNRGSANYPVPPDTDVEGLDSVSIWCDRFNVSFGAAELTAPA